MYKSQKRYKNIYLKYWERKSKQSNNPKQKKEKYMIIFYTVVKVYGFPPGCFWGILQELSHPIHNCYSCGTEL